MDSWIPHEFLLLHSATIMNGIFGNTNPRLIRKNDNFQHLSKIFCQTFADYFCEVIHGFFNDCLIYSLNIVKRIQNTLFLCNKTFPQMESISLLKLCFQLCRNKKYEIKCILRKQARLKDFYPWIDHLRALNTNLMVNSCSRLGSELFRSTYSHGPQLSNGYLITPM